MDISRTLLIGLTLGMAILSISCSELTFGSFSVKANRRKMRIGAVGFMLFLIAFYASTSYIVTDASQVCLNHGCTRNATYVEYGLLTFKVTEEEERDFRSNPLASYTQALKINPEAHDWASRDSILTGRNCFKAVCITGNGSPKGNLHPEFTSKKFETPFSLLFQNDPELLKSILKYIFSRARASDWGNDADYDFVRLLETLSYGQEVQRLKEVFLKQAGMQNH